MSLPKEGDVASTAIPSRIDMDVRQRRGPPVSGSDTVVHGMDNKHGSKKSTPPNMGVTNEKTKLPLWVLYALSSGACAAANGVFAKLTTTSLTSRLAAHLAALLGQDGDGRIINIALRGGFFGLNLLFNAIMWALFTAALTKGDSTTRVSIINVSANFFLTAILGWAIFAEKLPLQWWAGTILLAAGNVVIGMRETAQEKQDVISTSEDRTVEVEENHVLLSKKNLQPVPDD